MDVVFGATDVPLSGRLSAVFPYVLVALFLVLILAPSGFAPCGYAMEPTSPLHYSAERQLWNRRENKVELFGGAIIRQPGEVLTADSVVLDLSSRTVHAKGNCVYMASDVVIHGEEMKFNLDTRTGSIIRGRVSSDSFSLAGERINKLGAKRFQTHWGEYSTCRDCPQSWALQAEDVDLEVEGYGYLKNVMIKVKDAPGVWFPYLVVPIKTQRQSGFLLPTMEAGDQHGFMFVLPFFWAINRSSDMTFGLGEYTRRGRRFEWEGRYSLSPRSNGVARYYFLGDAHDEVALLRDPGELSVARWALDISQTMELPWGIEAKTRILEVSDNLYPNFIGDVPGREDPVLSSDVILSKATPHLSAFVAAKRMRNLLNTNPDVRERLGRFDPKTVQKLPEAVVTTNDRFLFSTPVAAGVTVGITNFARLAGPFDYHEDLVPFGTDPNESTPAPRPGIDPVREATRVAVTPSLYTTLRPLEVASVIPSATYYGYFYSFHDALPNLNRGYLHLQTELSTQLERVYDTNDPVYPKTKHLIRPFLLYSNIPYVREESDHPFLAQIRQREGYNFDNKDLVPLDASPSNINYFVPLGNSLSYGFTTQLIRRRGDPFSGTAAYQRSVEFSASQAVNFKRPEERFSRLNSRLGFNFDRFSWANDYSYTPYLESPRSTWTSSMTFILERALKQRILMYDRSLTLTYAYNRLSCGPGSEATCGGSALGGNLSFSLSDYILPSFSSSYNFLERRFMNQALNVSFQSPSRCWKFAIGIAHNVTTGFGRSFELALNLTGSGFGGVADLASELTSNP